VLELTDKELIHHNSVLMLLKFVGDD